MERQKKLTAVFEEDADDSISTFSMLVNAKTRRELSQRVPNGWN